MYHEMVYNLKKFFRLTIPNQDKSEFIDYINQINIKRGKMTAVSFMVIEVAIIFASILIQYQVFLQKPKFYYLIMYFIMIFAMVIFLTVFIKLEKNIPRHRLAINITGIIFAEFILLWCAGITLMEQTSSNQIIIFTVAVICEAVVPIYPPKTLLFIYLTVEVIFIILMPDFQKSSRLLFEIYVNSASFMAISWAASYMIYKNKISEFTTGKIIREKNAELERMNKELTEANQRLEKLSVTDGLTNIYNRSYFDKTLKSEWDRCKRYGIPITLIMVDIDYFKELNDNYGHQAGDHCIRQIACALSQCAKRASDVVARYGGDEFAVILPHMEKENVQMITSRIKRKVKDLSIPHAFSQNSGIVSISIGTHTMIPSDQKSISEFIGGCDKALYEAKKTRDNVVIT